MLKYRQKLGSVKEVNFNGVKEGKIKGLIFFFSKKLICELFTDFGWYHSNVCSNI